MEEVINTALGPFSTVVALFYLRLAVAKTRAGEDGAHVLGAWICVMVMAGLSLIRGAGALDIISFETTREWVLPMGIPVYAVHCYMAYRLTEIVQQRQQLRDDARQTRLVIKDIIRNEQESE